MAYRAVDLRIWADERVRRLSLPQPNGRDCWLYLLTARESCCLPGVIPAGAAALAETLRWAREGFLEAFKEVSREGLAKADWEAGLVFIPKAIRYNPPQSPNVVKGWVKAWGDVPECALKAEIFQTLKAFVDDMGEAFQEAFQKAFPEGYGHTSPNQDQDQDQDQETTTSVAADAAGGSDQCPPPATSNPAARVTGNAADPPAKKPKARKDGKPSDPRHKPLSDDLEAAGWPHHGGMTAKAVANLLALADRNPATTGDAAPAEVLSRAAKAKVHTGFPMVRELHELVTRWGHFETPAQTVPLRPERRFVEI